MAVHRHPRLARQHQALLAGACDITHTAGAEPAGQPRLPSVLPGLLEFLLDTQFNPDAFSQQIAADSSDGLWGRVCQAAYLESATPYGQPFTGRQFSNDEVYLSGCKQNELKHGQEKVDGIINYVRMRRDSARQQLEQARKETPRATDRASFPAMAEPLPPKI